jgi:hypothetical protein
MYITAPPTLYTRVSTISFFLLFLLFIVYYITYKPDYIKNDYNQNLNNRLIIIYSLLFSSSLSLFTVFITIIIKYYYNPIQ